VRWEGRGHQRISCDASGAASHTPPPPCFACAPHGPPPPFARGRRFKAIDVAFTPSLREANRSELLRSNSLRLAFRQIKIRKRIAGRCVVHEPMRKRRTGRATVMRLAPPSPLSGALACRRSTTALAGATERSRSAPVHALPGTELRRKGRYPLPAVPVQRVLPPQAGRNAGRAFWPGAAREPRLTRPRPAGTVLAPFHRRHPAASLRAR
jgi:hypothetical protein